ncbi:MAG: M3 family peptidase [Nevskiaceae bacterium]|nr:MAG: M3 family peptidase [Nevskiaceae bacterium]TBR71400.1 MAG: M3 family peptidase [Nevskiaceae bacterium]
MNTLRQPAFDTCLLPDFAHLDPAQVGDRLEAVLAENRARLDTLLNGPVARAPTWESFVEPLTDMDERLSRVWGPVGHLFSVTSTPEWRGAYNAGLPKVTEYGLEMSLNEALFHAWQRLATSPAHATFSATRKKIVADTLRDFRLSGIALPAADKPRFKAISMRLSEIQSTFEEHLIDAVKAYGKLVTNEAELAGMTAQGKTAAAEKAQAKGQGGWLLTLDYPGYLAVAAHADNRALRRELYEAYATRASERGPNGGAFDNTPLMNEILALRQEEAALLGFANFAELALQTRMADSAQEIEAFLLDLARRARPRAEAELTELQGFARERDGITDFAPWDVTYYAEKLRERKFGLSDETLRPYFPVTQVIDGLFALTHRLYGVTVARVDGIGAWHPDVTTYVVRAEGGEPIGLFYVDLYARDDKRGGAWMDECIGRRRTAHSLQKPVSYLTCNFAPPVAGHPALLTHDEVLTLFHEFGHSLQHLLTRVDEAEVSGIRGVAWDAVELPSQFMENWAYERDTLNLFARHWQTGAPLPDTLLEKLKEDRRFGAGLATLRQVEFALFDLRLHTRKSPDIDAVLNETRREVSVFPPPDWNRFPCSFSHIFAGGYAAGYYSYKWAEVLSADAFAAFTESRFDPEVAHRFRDTILAEGGARDAKEVYRTFRGRDATVDALLKQDGLVAEAEG